MESGWLSDRIPYPAMISLAGNVLLAVGYVLVGPAPFTGLETGKDLLYVSAAIIALGFAQVSFLAHKMLKCICKKIEILFRRWRLRSRG